MRSYPSQKTTKRDRNNQIVEYYDFCEDDYRYNWHLEECMAIHIGYWDNTTTTLREALIKQNELMAKKVEINQNDKILDAGCGVGGSSIFLAKTFGCKVTGITLSKKQAISAVNFSKLHDVEELTQFHVMDFNNTAFRDSSFDVVWALESSCYADDKEKFIKESYRLLKKGGRLIVADAFETKKKYSGIERAVINNWINRWAVNSLGALGSFKDQLASVGFGHISFQDITSNVLPSSRRLFHRSLCYWPFAKLARWKGTRSKVQNDNVTGAIFQYLFMKLKLGKYGMFYAVK